MRTRNLGVRPVLRVVQCAFAAAALTVAAGCGGGGDGSAPSFSNGAVRTTPAPLTYVGGNASASVDITDSSGVPASSVVVDVVDAAGASIIGGPQVMNPTATAAGTYNYSFAVPNNIFGTANKVYTVKVTATDANGNRPAQPVVIGTINVPFPPPPPGGP